MCSFPLQPPQKQKPGMLWQGLAEAKLLIEFWAVLTGINSLVESITSGC